MLKIVYLFTALHLCAAFLNAQAPQVPLPGLHEKQIPKMAEVEAEASHPPPLKISVIEANHFAARTLSGTQPPQARLTTTHPPLAIIIASSDLRWTQPVVVSSIKPETLLKILNQPPRTIGLHPTERAIESRPISQVDPYVELSPAEMALFCSDEVLRHLSPYETTPTPSYEPHTVAIVVVVYSAEKIGYKFIHSDALIMLQHSWLTIARMEQPPAKRINALQASLALCRTIQSIAELNRERGFYLGR